MSTNRSSSLLAIVVGIGCLCIVCLCFCALVFGGAAWFMQQAPSMPNAPDFISTLPVIEMLPTEFQEIPLPIETLVPIPDSFDPSLTGNQQSNDHYLYDDFSSDALGWPVYDDGKTILGYESEEYAFQIAEPDYYDWAYVPAQFMPTDIWFDVREDPATQAGTFGVYCQYQDSDNYQYVEFDLAGQSFTIAQVVDGEIIPLMAENSQGQYWQEIINLTTGAGAVNRVGVSCYPDSVTVFINDEYQSSVTTATTFPNLGQMALYVYAYPYADENGYKVYFDNIEIYQPVQ